MKAARNAKNIALTLCTLLSVAGCGGGAEHSEKTQSISTDTPGTTNETSQQINEDNSGFWPPNNQPITVSYANVVRLSLQTLSIKGINASHIQVAEGSDLIEDLVVDDEELRFITPADPGKNKKIKLVFDGNGIKRSLNIQIATSRPAGIKEITTFDESDTDRTPVPLTVKGLGPSNEILDEDLIFEIDRKIKMDTLASNALLNVNQEGIVSLRKYWKPLQSKSGFILAREDLRKIMESLPDGDIDFSITFNGDDEDSAFAREWAFIAQHPAAKLEGKVVDSRTKAPILHLAGKKVAIRGDSANGTRAISTIDSKGQFSLDNLPPGKYTAELLDSNTPGLTKTFFTIKKKEKQTLINLEYWSEAYKTHKIKNKKPTLSNKNLDPGASTQNKLVTGILTGEDCYTIFPEGENKYGFGIASSPRSSAPNSTCEGKMTIPQGVQSISLKMVVIAYKWLTGVGRIYDDWSYSVTGLPKFIQRQGNSLPAYKRGGIIYDEGCIQVSHLTKNSPYNFYIKTDTTNDKGDALTVGYFVETGCNDQIEISNASFNTTNKKGYNILNPVNHDHIGRPNYPGAYISIPQTGNPKAWGIPLAIDYKPTDAVIKDVKLVATGKFGEASASIFDQKKSIKKGSITFEDLSIPENIIETEFNGNINFKIEAQGEINGIKKTSGRFPISIIGSTETEFTPLFFAGKLFGNERRYGQGKADEGGDSWATWKTIRWLQGNQYRFNDISASHIAQKSNGRSVLSHTGHSDGAQLDLRYADGKGGFSEKMGGVTDGSHILNALKKPKTMYTKRSYQIQKTLN